MKNRLAIVSALGLALSIAPAALAGTHRTEQVYVNTSYHYAYGSLGSARNSSDANQLIGCDVQGDGRVWASCYARDAANHYVSCTSEDPTIVDAARAIRSASYVYFQWSGSACSLVLVSNNSMDELPR